MKFPDLCLIDITGTILLLEWHPKLPDTYLYAKDILTIFNHAENKATYKMLTLNPHTMITYRNCFAGLNVHSILSSNNFFYIEHANKAGSYRIFAPYEDAKDGNYTFQKDLGKLLNQTFDGSWRWHHVVAGEHLRKLFPLHTAAKLYDEEVPTVLVHQDSEHIDFNLLQAHGVHEVFDLPKDKTVLTGKDRNEYMNKLKRVYATVYEHDDVLNRVALNIFSLM